MTDDNDDGLLLNVNLFQSAPRPAQPKKNSKPRSWTEKKNSKKANLLRGRGRFNGPQRQPEAEPSAPPQTGNLLKGYELEAPSQHKPRAPSPIPAPERAPSPSPPPQEPKEKPKRQSFDVVSFLDEVEEQKPKKKNPSAVPTQQQHQPTQQQLRNYDNPKKVGRVRLQSRLAGNREATPDQDDIRAGSDDDEEDVMAAVAAAVARDKAVEEELAEQRKSFGIGGVGGAGGGGYYSSDNEDEMDQDRRTRSATDVVDFGGYDDSAYPPIREQQKKKRARWESVGGPAPSVRPGTLTHAGDAGTATDELFAQVDVKSFQGLGIYPPLATHLETLGFKVPTQVQGNTIPVLLSDKDALVNAPTGSGKTLSYLAPIMHDLATASPRVSRSDGTLALIICPTRELCLQVVDVLTLIARRFVWIVPGAVHGGENRAKEKARLRKGVSILITTPGRLLDHLENTGAFRIDQLRWLVLDEADRLLDLGFEKKIAQIIEKVNDKVVAAGRDPEKRRSVLLSATLHGGLGGLAGLSLENPVAIGWSMTRDASGKIIVGEEEESADGAAPGSSKKAKKEGLSVFDIPKQLKQSYVEVPCKLRLVALAAMLRMKVLTAPDRAKIVVFFSNCDSVEYHHAVLNTGAWATAAGADLLPHGAPLLKLHGNMPQAERTSTLLRFTKAAAGVLLCTDVAARGLDFPAVTVIIQFDPPGTTEEYVHRVGRTARLGHAGEALLFIQPSEKGYVDHLNSLGVKLTEESPVAALDKTLGMDAKAGKGLPIERHHGAFRLQREIMEIVAEEKELRALAETAFRSFVRAYATHSTELKPYFNVKTLHLGHVAHSFGLKENPSMVGRSMTGEQAKRHKLENQKNQGRKGKGGGLKGRQQATFSPVKAGKGGYVLS